MGQPSDLRVGARIAVLGTKSIALGLVQRLADADLGPSQLVTWDDSLDSRSRAVDLESVCRKLSVPFTSVRRANDAYAELSHGFPDIVLVAGWYRIIPPEVLNAVPNGFVGIHYSPLPEYRGSAPVVWQLINGVEEIGYSLFRLGPEMDEGQLASSGRVPAGSGYVAEVLRQLDNAALDELVRIAPALANGSHIFHPQPDRRPSYSSVRTPADGRIDWARSAAEIVRVIRAQSRPYPGAWSMQGDAEVRIWRASVEDNSDYYGVPGHVIRIIEDGPVVACGGNEGVILEEFDGPNLRLTSRLR